MADTATCPQCGRTVNVRTVRFGIRVYARHKMARLSGHRQGQMPHEVAADLVHSQNNDAAPVWEVDCPMGGQPV